MSILKKFSAAATAALCLFLFSVNSYAASLCTVYISGTVNYDKAFECLDYVNKQRAAAGLEALSMNGSLMEAAVLRAYECRVYFSHTRPNGESCESLQNTNNYYGENVATGYNSAKDVVSGWMSSAGHRANILNPNYHSVAIANVNGVWVQEFSGDYSSASRPANTTQKVGVSCLTSSLSLKDSAYSSSTLTAGSSYDIDQPGLYYNGMLCYGVDASNYSCSVSDSSVAEITGGRIKVKSGGTFTVTYTLKGTSLSVLRRYTAAEPIKTVNISDCNVSYTGSFTYSGKQITPDVTVTDPDGRKLVNGKDYTVTYENNVNAGTGCIYIYGKGNCKGDVKKSFRIKKKSISDSRLDSVSFNYDGKEKTPKLVGLNEYSDYTITYKNNTDPGTAAAKAVGRGNYDGEVTLTFEIKGKKPTEKKSYGSDGTTIVLESDTVTLEAYKKKCAPKVVSVILDDGTVLPKSEYTVSYENNDHATKSAEVCVRSDTEKYNGIARRTFTILPKDVSDAKITLSETEFEYTGRAIVPEVTVEGFPASEYSVGTQNSVGPGTATLTVTGCGIDLTGKKKFTYEIVKKNEQKLSQTVSASYSEISCEAGSGSIDLKATAKTKLTFTSSDTSVAKVSSSGAVTPVRAGSAVITIKAEETDKYSSAVKTVTVTVFDKPENKDKKTQTINVPVTALYMTCGEKRSLDASAKTSLSYRSTDTSVVKASGNGVLTAVSAGSASIVITAAESDTCSSASLIVSVTVISADQTILLQEPGSYCPLYVGETHKIKASAKTKLTYEIEDPSVATVSSDGVVTAKKAGSTYVTITAAADQNYGMDMKFVAFMVYERPDNNQQEPSVGSDTKPGTGNGVRSPQKIKTQKSYSLTTDTGSFQVYAVASTDLTYSSNNSKVIKVNKSGKATVKGVGSATITVKAAGTKDFAPAAKKIKVTVRPKSPNQLGVVRCGRETRVDWGKTSGISGYQVSYMKKSSDKYSSKLVSSKKTSLTFSVPLKKVRVRTYKTVDGKKYYSDWIETDGI